MSGSLRNLLITQPYRQIIREYSGIEVYFLPTLGAYLKIGEIARNSALGWERNVLTFLSGKASVPKVLDFEVVDGFELILISEVRGDTYADQIAASSNESEILLVAERVASEMRRLHDIAILECDLDQRLNVKLKKAQQNIQGGFVDESDFEVEDLGKTAEQIFKELTWDLPPDEDLVFTHGDLCLPNIMICGLKVAGFIDLDRGGVGDRYQDIALFLRSFQHNCPVQIDVESAFCRGYGINDLSRDKMSFYRKLDELF